MQQQRHGSCRKTVGGPASQQQSVLQIPHRAPRRCPHRPSQISAAIVEFEYKCRSDGARRAVAERADAVRGFCVPTMDVASLIPERGAAPPGRGQGRGGAAAAATAAAPGDGAAAGARRGAWGLARPPPPLPAAAALSSVGPESRLLRNGFTSAKALRAKILHELVCGVVGERPGKRSCTHAHEQVSDLLPPPSPKGFEGHQRQQPGPAADPQAAGLNLAGSVVSFTGGPGSDVQQYAFSINQLIGSVPLSSALQVMEWAVPPFPAPARLMSG